MSPIVQYTDWLDEEVGNMARDGLRTLVVARKLLTEEQYVDFEVSDNVFLTTNCVQKLEVFRKFTPSFFHYCRNVEVNSLSTCCKIKIVLCFSVDCLISRFILLY